MENKTKQQGPFNQVEVPSHALGAAAEAKGFRGEEIDGLDDGWTSTFYSSLKKVVVEKNKERGESAGKAGKIGKGSMDYHKAWELLAGRTITPSFFTTSYNRIFDGSEASIPPYIHNPKKQGIFITKQKTSFPSWSETSIIDFNTFVIEFDEKSIEDQQQLIRDSGIPYSFMVFSGTKSLHTYIILEEPITSELWEHFSSLLLAIFPNADSDVLLNPNQLARFPIVSPYYNQPLLDYVGATPNTSFFDWIASRSEEMTKQVFKTSTPDKESQVKLRKYYESHGEKGRVPCPICRRKGKDSLGKNLSIREIDHKLLFHCHRCKIDDTDYRLLQREFLEKPKKDPNLLFDLIQNYVADKFRWHYKTKLPLLINPDLPNLLDYSDDDTMKAILYPVYENICRQTLTKFWDGSFEKILYSLALKNSIVIKDLPPYTIPLVDGTFIKLKGEPTTGTLETPTDYYLNLTQEQWLSPKPTPIWDQFCSEHTTPEEQDLLEAFFGYIFSGSPVKSQQCMLIILGPPDTGKSVLLEFLQKVLGKRCTSQSINGILNSNVSAFNIIGKRLAISSESSIQAKNSETFRSLIPGEEVQVRQFYVGEMTLSHNTVFVSVTNQIGFLENSPENAKRIRVVNWENSIPKEKMDFNFLDKLMTEAPSIIAKCLRAYIPYTDKRFPFTKASQDFMDEAGANANPIAHFFRTYGITSGDIFCSTKDLLYWYKKITNDNSMAPNSFGFKVKVALNIRGNADAKKGGVRGMYLNKSIKEIASIDRPHIETLYAHK